MASKQDVLDFLIKGIDIEEKELATVYDTLLERSADQKLKSSLGQIRKEVNEHSNTLKILMEEISKEDKDEY